MSDLRGEIWSKVRNGTGYGATLASEAQFAREDALASAITDDIIALIRKALLSDAAVEAARLTFGGRDEPISPYVEGCLLFDARHAIVAALDAAFGEEGE